MQLRCWIFRAIFVFTWILHPVAPLDAVAAEEINPTSGLWSTTLGYIQMTQFHPAYRPQTTAPSAWMDQTGFHILVGYHLNETLSFNSNLLLMSKAGSSGFAKENFAGFNLELVPLHLYGGKWNTGVLLGAANLGRALMEVDSQRHLHVKSRSTSPVIRFFQDLRPHWGFRTDYRMTEQYFLSLSYQESFLYQDFYQMVCWGLGIYF